jgi:hypothetical protein
MTEQRTFPEELLAAADLCVLECSTLLLLRRRTLSGNVLQDPVIVCVDGESEGGGGGGENVDRGDNREDGGDRKGKKNKKKKTEETENENKNEKENEEVKERPVTNSSQNITQDSENVLENFLDTDETRTKEDSIEAVAGRLCTLIVKSIALLITFTAEKQANERTHTTYDARTEMECSYAPYIGMKRVLTQLQRASSLEMNLSRLQWDTLLWHPLARTVDNLTHRHMLKHIVFEDITQLAICEGEGEDEGEDYGGGLGEAQGEEEGNEEGEEYPNPADDENEVEVEVEQGSVAIVDKTEAIEETGPRSTPHIAVDRRTRKQREAVYAREVSVLTDGIAAHQSLVRVTLDVIRILTLSSDTAGCLAGTVVRSTVTTVSSNSNSSDNSNTGSEVKMKAESDDVGASIGAGAGAGVGVAIIGGGGDGIKGLRSLPCSLQHQVLLAVTGRLSPLSDITTQLYSISITTSGTTLTGSKNKNIINNGSSNSKNSFRSKSSNGGSSSSNIAYSAEREGVVRMATERALRGSLTAHYMCSLLQLTDTFYAPPSSASPSSTSTFSSSESASAEELPRTAPHTPSSLSSSHFGALTVLSSQWMRDLFDVLQLGERELHVSLSQVLSALFDALLLSLHNIFNEMESGNSIEHETRSSSGKSPTQEESNMAEHRPILIGENRPIIQNRANMALQVFSHCVGARSLKALNALLSSPFYKPLHNFNTLKMNMEMDTVGAAIRCIVRNIFHIASSEALCGISATAGRGALRKGGVGCVESAVNSGVESGSVGDGSNMMEETEESVFIANGIVERAELCDRVCFASLCALENAAERMTECKGEEEGEDGVNEVEERVEERGRETKRGRGSAECVDVMGTALALWKTSRSKIGMWVALSVFRERLVKGRERGCGGGSVESVISQYQFKECSEMLLSAYFSRTKGTFRTKNVPQNVPQKGANDKSHNNSNSNNNSYSNSNSNNGRACVVVITSWDDIKDFLLPILPLTEQLLFAATAVSSLSLSPSTSLSTSDSSIGFRSAVIRGGDVSLDGEEPLPQPPLFQPVKWARHASGLMLLVRNGLSFSPPQQTTQSAPHSATHSAAQDVLGPIVKALGYGSCDCWSALSCLAASATATCSGGQMTGGQKTGGAGIGTDKLFLVLQRIEYFLFSFLELNEQWKIDSSLNDIPESSPWLCVAQDVLLCDAVMTCVCSVQDLLNSIGDSPPNTVLPSDPPVSHASFHCA